MGLKNSDNLTNQLSFVCLYNYSIEESVLFQSTLTQHYSDILFKRYKHCSEESNYEYAASNRIKAKVIVHGESSASTYFKFQNNLELLIQDLKSSLFVLYSGIFNQWSQTVFKLKNITIPLTVTDAFYRDQFCVDSKPNIRKRVSTENAHFYRMERR